MPSSADLTDLSSAQPPSMEENGAHDLPQDVVDAVQFLLNASCRKLSSGGLTEQIHRGST